MTCRRSWRPRPGAGATAARSRSGSPLRFVGGEDEIAVTRPPGHQIEFEAWRWADMDELIGLIVPFKRGVYEQVVRDFAPLAKPRAA